MQWFKTRYVQSLEQEISRLRTENKNLLERLISVSRPEIALPKDPTPDGINDMLKTTDIFEDILDTEPDDTIVDNRKENFDEFVS